MSLDNSDPLIEIESLCDYARRRLAMFLRLDCLPDPSCYLVSRVRRGNAYPAEYQGNLFVNDLAQGIVRAVSFDSNGDVDQVRTFTTGAQIVVQIVQGPDGNLYYVDLNDNTIGRWVFV